jgi:uncharacterized protein (DUF4415 family)
MAKQDTASAFLQAIRKGEADKSSATVKVSLEVDRAVFAYFEEGGDLEGGCALTKMHQVLRAHVDAAQVIPEISAEIGSEVAPAVVPETTKRRGWRRR